MTCYKVICQATIELITALHIGCGQESPIGAATMMKNGNGELMIPGSSIAGIFNETLKVLNNVDLTDLNESASPLIFRSINLTSCQITLKIRDHVKIDRSLKSAENGSLFSYWEIQPEDVSFDLMLEIDNLSLKNEKNVSQYEDYVKLVFSSWHQEGFFIGAHSSTGNGYCKIKTVKVFRVNNEDTFSKYLDHQMNFLEENTYIDTVVKQRYKKWNISIDINNDKTDNDVYGCNAILIKGGSTHKSLANHKSDYVFVNTGKRLFIPGSSLKGSIAQFLEKYKEKDFVNRFMGEDKTSKSALLFSDLFIDLKGNYNDHLINIERHAEDEFTRAVYGSGKFNEERLFYAKAKGYLRIPVQLYDQNKDEFDRIIAYINKGFSNRLISLGANACYPEVQIEEES